MIGYGPGAQPLTQGNAQQVQGVASGNEGLPSYVQHYIPFSGNPYQWNAQIGGDQYSHLLKTAASPFGFGRYFSEVETSRKQIQPEDTVNELISSPWGQAYGNPEARTAAYGVQGVREGEAQQIRQGEQEAANLGLGRGFAQQQTQNTRRQANYQGAQMVLAAQEEGAARRYQQALLLASALQEADAAYAGYYAQKRALEAAENAALLGAIGQIGGGLLSGIGSVVGGGIGG